MAGKERNIERPRRSIRICKKAARPSWACYFEVLQSGHLGGAKSDAAIISFLIHEADPVTAGSDHYFFARVVRPSIRPPFSKSRKTKLSSEISVHYLRNCGSVMLLSFPFSISIQLQFKGVSKETRAQGTIFRGCGFQEKVKNISSNFE